MRIVSLCPSLTELVFALGRGEDLVGITQFCVHPVDRVDAIEKVGGTKTPVLDRILELAPDLVLFNQEENRREDYDALRGAGLHLCNTFPKDALETAAMVRQVGEELECTSEAEAIAADIEERVSRVTAEARGRAPVRFAYLIWRQPWMSVNRDTFASALLAQAGGINVFAEHAERYPAFDLSELAAAGPELVLLCTEPFLFKGVHVTEVADACGLDPAHVRIADGEYLSWHGSRTPDGVDYAADLIAGASQSSTRP
jgi:iron complex transport system substrate-binding protein